MKLLVFAKLLPLFLDKAIEAAEKADDSALANTLRTDAKELLDQVLVDAGTQEVQNDREDRAHFVAHLASTLAQGRQVKLSEVRELVTVANAIAAEALVQCGVIQPPEALPLEPFDGAAPTTGPDLPRPSSNWRNRPKAPLPSTPEE